jgi:hypothetical protein
VLKFAQHPGPLKEFGAPQLPTWCWTWRGWARRVLSGAASRFRTTVGGTGFAVADDRLLDVALRLARTLTPGDLDHTLSQITAAAVESLPDTDYASITILHKDGRLETAAPTDGFILGLDAAQCELREGPCYEDAADAVHVAAPDLAHDARFPRYAVSAVAAGIHAQAGIRLFDAPKSRGALNLYAAGRRLRRSRRARRTVPAPGSHGDRLCPGDPQSAGSDAYPWPDRHGGRHRDGALRTA